MKLHLESFLNLFFSKIYVQLCDFTGPSWSDLKTDLIQMCLRASKLLTCTILYFLSIGTNKCLFNGSLTCSVNIPLSIQLHLKAHNVFALSQ